MDYFKNGLYPILMTVVFILVIAIFLLLSWWIQRRTLKRAFNTRSITLTGMLVALGIALNMVGKALNIVGMTINFGNLFAFVTGMLFGPMMGMISGIIIDVISNLIWPSAYMSLGFTLAAALFGFMGSTIFMWKKNKWIEGKVALTFGLFYLVYLFGLSPLAQSVSVTFAVAYARVIAHLPFLPANLVIYISLTIVSFELLMQLIQHRWAKQSFIWALRKGSIHFKPRKSKYDKAIAKAKKKNEVKVEQ